MVKTPTSVTSLNRLRYRYGSPHNARWHGFTLIELLVVLVIGSLLVGLAPPAFERLRDGSQYRDTVRAMVTDMRQARQQALTFGQVVVFRIDLADRKFGIVGQPFKPLPTNLEVKTTVGKSERADNAQQAAISFLPDGGSSGGTIELLRASGGGVRLRIDWLFGKISQEPRSP